MTYTNAEKQERWTQRRDSKAAELRNQIVGLQTEVARLHNQVADLQAKNKALRDGIAHRRLEALRDGCLEEMLARRFDKKEAPEL